MDKDQIKQIVDEYSQNTHGSSDDYKDNFFIQGPRDTEFVPLSFLQKKMDNLNSVDDLFSQGFVSNSIDLFPNKNFNQWYEKCFSRKLSRRYIKKISLVMLANNKFVFNTIGTVNQCFEHLREANIILNGKNLPVQLGEWYAKSIFGLEQMKSTSQRGFDFFREGKRVEVKVDWGNVSSPKGIKVKKSLVELSENCILVYLTKSFLIREISYLDSSFIMRKFGGKGHTIFLKDSDVSQYFFSKSTHHREKVINSNAMLSYCSPKLAANLADWF